jgi:O-antigen ligase
MNYVNGERHRLMLGLNHSSSVTITQAGWLPVLVWLTVAVSSIVFLEPAPHDILVLSLVFFLFPLGLKVPREINVPLFFLMLFGAANLLAALTATDTGAMLRSLSIRIYVLFAWLLWASLVVADAPKFLRVMWNGYSFAALVAVAWGVLQYFGFLPDTLGKSFDRVTGPFKDANVFAPFLVPVVFYYMDRMLRIRGPSLAFDACKFLFLVYGLFLGFSRGAWLNMSIGLMFFIIFSMISARSLKHRLRLMIVVAAVGVAAVLTLYLAISYTEAGQLFVQRAALVQEYDVAAGGRFDTQVKALVEIGRNPIGIGPGMSAIVFDGVEPHNIYLHVAVEGGWIAALSFYLFLIITLSRGFSRINTTSALRNNLQITLAALMGVLVQSLFIDSTHWRHLWLLLAMTWAITVAIDRDADLTKSIDYVQNRR